MQVQVGQRWEPLHPWRKRRNFPTAEVLKVGTDVEILMAPCHGDQLPVRTSVPAHKFLKDFRQIGGGK